MKLINFYWSHPNETIRQSLIIIIVGLDEEDIHKSYESYFSVFFLIYWMILMMKWIRIVNIDKIVSSTKHESRKKGENLRILNIPVLGSKAIFVRFWLRNYCFAFILLDHSTEISTCKTFNEHQLNK